MSGESHNGYWRAFKTSSGQGLIEGFYERFGVAPNTYKKYEGGESSPSIEFSLAVCESFDVLLPWLAEDSGSKHNLSEIDISSQPSTVKELDSSSSIYMDHNGDVKPFPGGSRPILSSSITSPWPRRNFPQAAEVSLFLRILAIIMLSAKAG